MIYPSLHEGTPAAAYAEKRLPVAPDTPTRGLSFDWRTFAACRGEPLSTFYPTDADALRSTKRARSLCSTCPAIKGCLDDVDAFEAHRGLVHGFRAGMTANERMVRLKARRREAAA